MNAQQQYIFENQMKRFKVFKDQDAEIGDFDVAFEIDGKILFAHKYMLRPISPVFDAMLSERWMELSEKPIKIEAFSFDVFEELLNFIYSGKCKITYDNVREIVDIAEFYDVPELKEECVGHLIDCFHDDVCNIYEFIKRYKFKEFNATFDNSNFAFFLADDGFLNFQKDTVKNLVQEYHHKSRQGEIFKAVYKWCEARAIAKQEFENNINELIKDEIAEFLPFINFGQMNPYFFAEFVVERSYIFSDDDFNGLCEIFSGHDLSVLCGILSNRVKLYAKVTDAEGKTLKGEIQNDEIETIANGIQAVENEKGCLDSWWNGQISYLYLSWDARLKTPSTPSKLIKKDGVQYYLVYDDYAQISIKHPRDLGEDDYLIAEMVTEDGFRMSERECKIEMENVLSD